MFITSRTYVSSLTNIGSFFRLYSRSFRPYLFVWGIPQNSLRASICKRCRQRRLTYLHGWWPTPTPIYNFARARTFINNTLFETLQGAFCSQKPVKEEVSANLSVLKTPKTYVLRPDFDIKTP